MPMADMLNPRDPASGFKRRLTATVILLNLFIYCYVAATAYQSKHKYQKQTAISTQNLAILLDQQIKDEINSIDLALLAVKHEAEEQLQEEKINKEALNGYIVLQHSYLPSLQGIRILNSKGDAEYGTGGITPGVTVNLAFRDYFIAQRDNPKGDLFISKPVLGLVAKTWIINFSRRLNHPDGSFAGAVYASLTLDHYIKLFSGLKISANSSISLRDCELGLIARFPELENTVGSQKVSEDLTALVKAGTTFATYKARAGIDNVERTITYRKISDYPLSIIVALAEDEYLAAWRKEVLTMFGMVLIFTVVTLVSRRMLLSGWSREQEILSDLNNAKLALELRSERDRAQSYLDTVETIIVALDIEGRITSLNRKGCQVLGFQEDELKGKNWFSCCLPQPEGLETVYPLFLRLISGEAVPVLEYQEYPLTMKSGELRQIAWHIAVLRDEQGTIIGTLGAGEDITKRKLAEEALASSERFLKTVIDSEPECIKLLDSECNLLMMNPAGLEMIQADSLEQVKGQCMCPLITEPYRNDFIALTKQVFQGRPGSLEFETVGLKGRHIWLETHAVPFRNECGEIVSLLGITRDITERKLNEETLRVNEAKFRSIVETSQDWIWELDLSGKHTFSNARVAEILGYSLEDFLPMDLHELVHQEDGQEIKSKLPQLIAAKSGWRGWVIRWRHKDGSYRFLESDANPIINESGELVGFRGVDRDITERKKSEKALQESNKLLEEIIELSPICMAIVSMDGTIEHINRWAVETFGYSPDDIPNMERWWLLAYPDESYRAEVFAQWMGLVGKALAEKSEIERREYLVTCKDGRVRTTLIFGIPVLDKVFVIFDDITDRKLAEAERLSLERQLLQAQKLESLGVLAGGIAHDFNNILTAIMGNISYAKMDHDASQHAYEPLVRAEKAAKRAASLSKQLLSFSKGGEPVKRPISVRQSLEDALSLVLSGSNVEAIIALQPDLHAVNADEGQISQAFNNIIINAVQAMPAGGQLTVSAKNAAIAEGNSLGLGAGDYVEIAFTDVGCGIAVEDIGRIFDPYFTSKAGGSGLGLASTYTIISKHGGHISVSSSPGNGTCFTVLLPGCGEFVSEELKEALMPGDAQGVYSILVMDDDEMVRELADITLKRFGYEVVCCDNGAAAVSLYRTTLDDGVPFSLVIMDLTVPGGIGGIEAARQILAIDPQAQLIVSSGYSEDPVMANFSDYGFCAALEKPYDVAEIARILQKTKRG